MGRSRKAAGPRGQAFVCPSQACGTSVAPPNPPIRKTDIHRSVLLGTVAMGLLLLGYGRRAYAGPGPCTGGGTTVTCTGDQSGGIASGIDFVAPPARRLKVERLRDDISPATGIPGIYFASLANITINSDTTDGANGPFEIITSRAPGIYAVSLGNRLSITHTGSIATRGNYAYGIGAVASFGRVSVTQTGDISTRGASSVGIYAAGIYGASVRQRGSITTTGNGSPGIAALTFTGRARVRQRGTISTRGIYAPGIYALSYFGTTSVTKTGDIETRGFGADGIRTISGGRTTVKVNGDIATRGAVAYGINAYSYFGPLAIRHKGDITTRGFFADGIYATSTGKITITQTGDITVTGNGADAIDVNLPPGVGRSFVTVRSGSTITGGLNSGDGIDFQDGRRNQVVNFGTITTLGENAIEGEGTGAEIVYNYGTVTGDVHLGPGANRFINKSGGLFNTGRVFLGAGNRLKNAGTVSPGGANRIHTTALTGNMMQTSGGTFAVDLNLGTARADRLNATGTARLDGTVAVAVKNPALLKQRFVILSADGGVTDRGLQLGPVSPALQAELLFPNPNDVVLGVDVDFAPDGLNRNETNIGKNLNAALKAGGGTLGPVFDALLTGVFTLPAYQDALDQLSPEIYADTELAAVSSAFDFSNNLLSCHVNGTETAAINAEGQCLWVGGKGRYLDGDNTSQYIGFDETAAQFAGGAQFALNSVWRLGLGAGYQSSTLSTDTNATSEGGQAQGGVSLKYNPGALLLAGVVSGAHGWYDTMRPMAFGGFNKTAWGRDHEIDVLQGRLHASYVLGRPALYYKPMIDAAVTGVTLDDVRETGAGGASLLVRGNDHTVFTVSPALEIGTEWWWSNGTLVRPFVRGGATWFSEDDVTVTASFSGAPASVAPFAITAGADDVQADVAAGVEMIDNQDSALRIVYDGHFGDRFAVHAGGIKASVKF